jgi:hypothetical protein
MSHYFFSVFATARVGNVKNAPNKKIPSVALFKISDLRINPPIIINKPINGTTIGK